MDFILKNINGKELELPIPFIFINAKSVGYTRPCGCTATTVFKNDFWLSAYPCTRELWELVLNEKAVKQSGKADLQRGPQYPVCGEKFKKIDSFFQSINNFLLEGRIEQDDEQNMQIKGLFGLPTESQWEFAAINGEGTKYPGSNSLEEVAWYKKNSEGMIHPVGLKKPSRRGFYDLCGNINELCINDNELKPSLQRGSIDQTSLVSKGGNYLSDIGSCSQITTNLILVRDYVLGAGFRLVFFI